MSGLPLPQKGDLILADEIAELVRRAHWEQKISAASSGPRFAWATTTAAVTLEKEDFEVEDVIPCDGSEWTGDDPLTVLQGPLRFAIDNRAQGLIMYIAMHDGSGDWAWYPNNFPCPTDCECDADASSSA